jgi:DHA1 family bicyclomycin/chloramphenicol resistance-like MFS transporter
VRPSLAVLLFLTGISPLATDMYLPALPGMGHELHASAATIQLTLTGFLIGLAVGQLVAGPISDGTGRRPFLLAGPAAFLVFSLACALSPDGALLVAVRVAQGLAAGAGVAVGRAVINDFSSGLQADRRFAIVTSAGLVGPVVAPGIGGALLGLTTWRVIFLLLALVGAGQLIGVTLRVPETLPPERRHAGGLSANLGRMGALLRNRAFVGHVATACLGTCGFFTYIGGSSFVLQHVYGISEGRYALVFATNGLAMVTTSVLFVYGLGRSGAVPMRRAGLTVTVTASTFLLVTALTGTDRFAWTWVALCCVTAGMGLVLPASIALGQRAGATYAGTASALQGGLQMGIGALVTPLTGLLGYGSLIPMAALMAGFMALAVVSSFLVGDPDAARPALPVG